MAIPVMVGALHEGARGKNAPVPTKGVLPSASPPSSFSELKKWVELVWVWVGDGSLGRVGPLAGGTSPGGRAS